MPLPGRRSRVLAALAAALGCALAAVVVAADRTGDGPGPAAPDQVRGIEAQVALSPRVALFGDTVRADVDVVLDASRIDPGSVRIAAEFAPFEVVGAPEARRQDAGETVFLRTSFVLRCSTGTCVPSGQSALYEFAPARIGFETRAGRAADAGPVTAAIPPVRVFSRFAGVSSTTNRPSAPWQADVLSLPPASYRFGHGVVLSLLLAGAALAALAGLVLARLAWPRRRVAPAPEPEPPPAPEPSALEQALALLEGSIRGDGAAGRRRALELVAEELERTEPGEPELAGAVRAIAWSEELPDAAETSRLAARLRAALPHADEGAEAGDGRAA